MTCVLPDSCHPQKRWRVSVAGSHQSHQYGLGTVAGQVLNLAALHSGVCSPPVVSMHRDPQHSLQGKKKTVGHLCHGARLCKARCHGLPYGGLSKVQIYDVCVFPLDASQYFFIVNQELGEA